MSSDQIFFALATGLCGLAYILYWILGHAPWFIGIFGDNTKGSIEEVVTRRLFGFIIMGVVPFLTIVALTTVELEDLGLTLKTDKTFYYWLSFLTVAAVVTNYAAGHNKQNNSVYPQIRIGEWRRSTFFIEYLTWALYLLGYEFIFRGLLLFGSLAIMGTTEALVLNILIYAFAHLPKGNIEIIGSVIMGALLCFAAIQTGSMWIAFIAHVIMAWSNSILSFILNPEFKYAR